MIDRQGQCTAPGCKKPLRSSGAAYCNMHYTRLRRGSKDALAPTRMHCVQCGRTLKHRSQTKYCSHQCCVRFLRGTPEMRTCASCKTEFSTNDHGFYCSPECRREGTYDWQHRKRVKIRGSAATEKFSRIEIFERDGWRCQICMKKVRRKAKARQPFAPTLDHIIPLSRGGGHTRLNSQCAHYICNVRKSSKIVGQIRLIP